MPQSNSEYKDLLASFGRLAGRYCDNAHKLAADGDQRKLIGAYRVGLTAAIEGTTALLHQFYDGADDTFRRQIDTYIAATGMRPMLDAAAEVVGPYSLDTVSGLDRSRHFFEKAKGALRGIPGLVLSALPFAGAIPSLLGGIDTIIDNIADALRPTSDGGRPSIVERPPPIPSIQPTGCTWVTVYEGEAAADFDLFHTSSTVNGRLTTNGAEMGKVEVRVDGNPAGTLEPYARKFSGKKIEVHYISDASNSADVGTKKLG